MPRSTASRRWSGSRRTVGARCWSSRSPGSPPSPASRRSSPARCARSKSPATRPPRDGSSAARTSRRWPPRRPGRAISTIDRVLAPLSRLRRSALFELIFLVAVALSLALAVQAYAVKPYRIPSGSMEPTLQIDDRVLVDRVGHRIGAQPEVGDIIVFHPPAGADAEPPRCGAPSRNGAPCARPTAAPSRQTFIKRVVAVAGDTVAIRDGHVIRNGRRSAEAFAAPCGGLDGCYLPDAIT